MPITQSSIASNVISGATGPVGPTGATGITGATGSAPWITSGSNIYYNGGNVGVGVTSPLTSIQTGGDVMNGIGSSFATNLYYDGGSASNKYATNGYAGVLTIAESASGGFRFYTAPTNSSGAGAAATITERMRITSGGNVGIGTTNPSAPLTVGRVDSSNEGGQIDLCRASDNASAWAVDVFGNTSNPTFRIVDNVAAASRMIIDSSGNLQFNSGYGSVATAYGCRAWVNFNGSNGAIRGSGNVSSVNRNSTGDYSINFTTAMPNLNYSVSMGGSITFASGIFYGHGLNDYTGWTTSSCKVRFVAGNGTYFDPELGCISVFR